MQLRIILWFVSFLLLKVTQTGLLPLERMLTIVNGSYLIKNEWSLLGSHTSLEEAVLGCTDSTAFNFNELATELDDSCVPVVSGCTDEAAFNYNDAANVSDADSCVPVVSGCLDSTAVNFVSSANTDDGSCNMAVITFTVDMNGVEQPSAEYDNVVVNGSWNGWQGWGVTLADDDADGVYSVHYL